MPRRPTSTPTAPVAPFPGRWRSRSAAAVAVVLGGCSIVAPSSSETAPAGTATVAHPVDGDTVVVDISGREESVRFIGIDTPESVAPNRPVECFGAEAKARTAELLPEGTVVRLERDVEARDRYDRLLAYVIRDRDGVLVNRLLVDEGYAEARAFPPNLAHQGELDAAEAAARAAGRGLWPACGDTDTPIGPVASPP